MELAQLQHLTLMSMDRAVEYLGQFVPPPQDVGLMDGIVPRHIEKLPLQAVLQKLTRIPTGLRSASLLGNAGFCQEGICILRIVDEIGEDVLFLSIGLIKNDWTDLHRSYLEYFFDEDFDLTSGQAVADRAPQVPRKKIRAYITNSNSRTKDPSSQIFAAKVVHRMDSGYVHASSPHIMDMYRGDPPAFQTKGLAGFPIQEDYELRINSYYYRACTSYAIACKAFGQEEVFQSFRDLMKIYTDICDLLE